MLQAAAAHGLKSPGGKAWSSATCTCLSCLSPEDTSTPKDLWQRSWSQAFTCDTSVCLVAPRATCQERPKEMEKLLAASSSVAFKSPACCMPVQVRQHPEAYAVKLMQRFCLARPQSSHNQTARGVALLVRIAEAF